MSIDKIIHGLEGYGTTFQFEGELRALNRLADQVQSGVIVAIGSYRGQTDCALALHAHVPVYAIDNRAGSVGEDVPFGDVDRPIWMRNVLDLGVAEKVRPINLLSLQVAQIWTQPISLLFIDGSHDYDSVRDDLTAWLPHVVDGGIIGLHDTHLESVRRVISEHDDMVEFERADLTRFFHKESIWDGYTYENQTIIVRKGIGMQDDKSTPGEVRTYDIGRDPVRNCIDVGGNIGAFTVWIKELWPAAQVSVIEPERSSFAALYANVGMMSGVGAVHGAILYNPGGQVLYVNPNNSGCHKIIPISELTTEQSINVMPLQKTYTLEQIMLAWGWKSLDLLKLDCEGSEVDILTNCTEEFLRSVKRIVGEFHAGPEAFEKGICQRMMALGFEVHWQTDPLAHATFVAVNTEWHEPPTLPDTPPELPPIEYGTAVEEKPKKKAGRPKKS